MKSLVDFNLSLFQQLRKNVPDDIEKRFGTEFSELSAVLYPLLIFFKMVRNYPLKGAEGRPLTCIAEQVGATQRYAWYIKPADLVLVYFDDHRLEQEPNDIHTATLLVYQSDQLNPDIKESIVNQGTLPVWLQQSLLLPSSFMLRIKGFHGTEGSWVNLDTGEISYRPGKPEENVIFTEQGKTEQEGFKFNLFVQMLYDLHCLCLTSTVYGSRRPIHDDGPSVMYDEKDKQPKN